MKKLAVIFTVLALGGCGYFSTPSPSNEEHNSLSCYPLAKKYGKGVEYRLCETRKAMNIAMMLGQNNLYTMLQRRYQHLLYESFRNEIKREASKMNPLLNVVQLNGKHCELKKYLLSTARLECK